MPIFSAFGLGLILYWGLHVRLLGMSDVAFRSVGVATIDVVPVSKTRFRGGLVVDLCHLIAQEKDQPHLICYMGQVDKANSLTPCCQC